MADNIKLMEKVQPGAPPAAKFPLKSPRGAKLATRAWLPGGSGKPKAVLLIIHGGGWHSGYFDGLGKYLSKELNIFVGAYDQPGCGYSEKEPDCPPQCSVHANGFDDFVEDVFASLEWAHEEASVNVGDESVPVFLLGESFGGLIVLDSAMQAQERTIKGKPIRLDGVVSLGGALQISPKILPPAIMISVLVWLAKYYPKTAMPAFDTSSTFDAAFGDKEWADIARNDPCVTVSMRPTLGAAAATLSSGKLVMAGAPKFPVPALLVHGKNDCRTMSEAAVEFADKAGPDKGKVVLVDTDGHQLLQDQPEIIRSVMKEVKVWLESKMKN